MFTLTHTFNYIHKISMFTQDHRLTGKQNRKKKTQIKRFTKFIALKNKRKKSVWYKKNTCYVISQNLVQLTKKRISKPNEDPRLP